MSRFSWALLFWSLFWPLSGKLQGPNVCPERVTRTVNVIEYYRRNVTTRHYRWCLNVPPRCSFYTTKEINDSRIAAKETSDVIDTCCVGYEARQNKCVALCPNCDNGECLNDACICHEGFTGASCQTHVIHTDLQSIRFTNNGRLRLVKSTTEQTYQPEIHNIVRETGGAAGTTPITSDERGDLVSGASAATAISVAVIICAIFIVLANHIKKKRASKTRVEVITHSIFHTPLPEPPPEKPDLTPHISTHVVCNMTFPAPKSDYDHPPSTGSYCAVLMPEPPDLELIHPIGGGEPLYDEIPSGLAPTPISQPPLSYKSSNLYMNTCAKTKL